MLPHTTTARVEQISEDLQHFLQHHVRRNPVLRRLQVGGSGDCLFHSVAAGLEDLLKHSDAAYHHVVQHIPIDIFREGKRSIVRRLRSLSANVLVQEPDEVLLDYLLQGVMRERFNQWPDQWSPTRVLQANSFHDLLHCDTIRAVGPHLAGDVGDIAIAVDVSDPNQAGRGRREELVVVRHGDIHLASLREDLRDTFQRTGNCHWGDATDLRYLCDALDVGFFMFRNNMPAHSARNRTCLYPLQTNRGNFPYFLPVVWDEPLHFTSAEIIFEGDPCYKRSWARDEVPDELVHQYNLSNTHALFGAAPRASVS